MSVISEGVIYSLNTAGTLWRAPGRGDLTAVGVTRPTASLWPYDSASFWNTSIGTGATYESAGGTQTANFLDTAVPSQLNWSTFTLSKWTTSVTDPVYTITMVDDAAAPTGEVIHLVAAPNLPLSNDPGNPDSWLTIVEPDGRNAHEFYKAQRTGATALTARRHFVYDLKTSLGWPTSPVSTSGNRASHASLMGGMMWPSEAVATGDPTNRWRHALAMAIPNSMLDNSYLWPAYGVDANAATAYAGTIPMGTLFAIPPSQDITTLGLAEIGLALATTLQDYGAYVVDRSTYATLYLALGSPSPAALALKAAWQALRPYMRRVTNASQANPGGPGARRRSPAPPFATL